MPLTFQLKSHRKAAERASTVLARGNPSDETGSLPTLTLPTMAGYTQGVALVVG